MAARPSPRHYCTIVNSSNGPSIGGVHLQISHTMVLLHTFQYCLHNSLHIPISPCSHTMFPYLHVPIPCSYTSIFPYLHTSTAGHFDEYLREQPIHVQWTPIDVPTSGMCPCSLLCSCALIRMKLRMQTSMAASGRE